MAGVLAKHTTQRTSSAVHDFVVVRTLTVVSAVLYLVVLENGPNSASFAIHKHKTIRLLVQFDTLFKFEHNKPRSFMG